MESPALVREILASAQSTLGLGRVFGLDLGMPTQTDKGTAPEGPGVTVSRQYDAAASVETIRDECAILGAVRGLAGRYCRAVVGGKEYEVRISGVTGINCLTGEPTGEGKAYWLDVCATVAWLIKPV